MKVQDLIKLLQDMPQHLDIFIDGYEGGVQVPCPPKVIGVDRNVNTESYYGPHEENRHSTDLAVLLSRVSWG